MLIIFKLSLTSLSIAVRPKIVLSIVGLVVLIRIYSFLALRRTLQKLGIILFIYLAQKVVFYQLRLLLRLVINLSIIWEFSSLYIFPSLLILINLSYIRSLLYLKAYTVRKLNTFKLSQSCYIFQSTEILQSLNSLLARKKSLLSIFLVESILRMPFNILNQKVYKYYRCL